jgi:hypothetical protein
VLNGGAVSLSDYSEFTKHLTNFLKYDKFSDCISEECIEASNDARLVVYQIIKNEKEGKTDVIQKEFKNPELAAYFLEQFVKTMGANIRDYNFLLAETKENVIEIYNSRKLIEVYLPSTECANDLKFIANSGKDVINNPNHINKL